MNVDALKDFRLLSGQAEKDSTLRHLGVRPGRKQAGMSATSGGLNDATN